MTEHNGSMHGRSATGGFVDLDGERYYVIRNVDRMPPFFVSVVSSADHWLFVSSSGGLTAGRVSPETALFPYLPVDRIHESNPHTGCKTILRVPLQGRQVIWEPFNREHDGRFGTSRNLYKNVLGNKLCFEEVNHDLALAFRYTWATSDRHGLVRLCDLRNLGDGPLPVEFVDGLQNILPAGTPSIVQANSSNLEWTRTSGPSSTVAGREKDLTFAREAAACGLVSASTVRERLDATPLEPAERTRLQARIEGLFRRTA